MLLAGMAWTRAKSVTAYSAMPPGAVAMTRSPGLKPATSLPTASNSPAHSSPIRAPTPPTTPCRWPEATMRSARLSVEARTRISTSLGLGTGFSRSRTSTPASPRTAAFMSTSPKPNAADARTRCAQSKCAQTAGVEHQHVSAARIKAAGQRYPPPGRLVEDRRLGLQGGEIGRCVQDILLIELADDRRHQRCPGAGPIAVLHVVELAPEIARRAACERRHRA